MTTYLGKSCSFCLPRVPFVNCRQFMYLVISLLVLRAGYGIWLYQFLIIAYLFTFYKFQLTNDITEEQNMQSYLIRVTIFVALLVHFVILFLYEKKDNNIEAGNIIKFSGIHTCWTCCGKLHLTFRHPYLLHFLEFFLLGSLIRR